MTHIDMQVHLLHYCPNDVNQFYGGVIAALASALSYLDMSKMQGQYHRRYKVRKYQCENAMFKVRKYQCENAMFEVRKCQCENAMFKEDGQILSYKLESGE